jgi:pimeloyl-ACP methyl ester carboxylesterase
VLLHGIGGSLGMWAPVLPALTAEREVIALDLPGFGRSPALPVDVVPDPATLGRTVSAFLAGIGVHRPHVAGNSLGGWIALEMAKQGSVRSATGVCPALWRRPLLGDGEPPRNRSRLLGRRLAYVLPPLVATRAGRRLALAGMAAHAERIPRRAAVEMAASYLRAPAYDATNVAMRRSFFTGGREIDVPVTLAWGERDRLLRPVPVDIPGARVLTLPDCGHIPTWDDPELVARVLLEGSAGASTSDPLVAHGEADS